MRLPCCRRELPPHVLEHALRSGLNCKACGIGYSAINVRGWRAEPDFDGATFDVELDKLRLGSQLRRVFECLKDGTWRTLDEIGAQTGDPPASVSARVRDLRKPKFGGFVVQRRRRGDPTAGLWEYHLAVDPSAPE